MALCSLARAYEVQPYVPVVNTPAEEAAKQAAIDALRVAWSGDNYSASNITSILSGDGISNPSLVVGNFNANGSWHVGLPTGATFSESDYNLNRDYMAELMALAYLDE
ncbi:MAG: hypothetical protein AAGC74_04500, partial [Verrucomicrobiota bacterium]